MSNVMDFTLPEVVQLTQKARFFKENDRDFIEISYVGSKDTIIKKVAPQHMAQFRDEWNAYCDGLPPKQRAGTPLTDIPSIQALRVDHYTSRNVHNLEELAALTDGQCQSLGHGVLTDREAARKLLSMRQVEAATKVRDIVTRESAKIGPVPAETYASQSELAEVKAQIGALTDSVTALVAALSAKPKRGRPPNDKKGGE